MNDINEKINNIEEELAQILEARYGKDVRQSIHNSIAKCYDEATGKIQQELIDSITTNAANAAASAKTATDKASAASTSATSAAAGAKTATDKASAASTSATSAAASAKTATDKASAASTSATSAAESAKTATDKASSASTSATNAAASAKTATDKASSASTSAANAEKYAKGDTDSALYYYNQCKSISQSLSGALKPKGTVAYSKLPSISTVAAGDMYNISDEFITNNLFKEGAGRRIPAGSNIYKTADSMWDVLAGSPVTGVKGAKESVYRQGNIEITAENIGALKVGGDAKDTTVTYTSNDSTTAPDATPPVVMTSGEKLSALLGKISTFGKNVRWLLSKMGSTDISTIGDGTVTGAISTLNSNYSKLGEVSQTNLGGTVPVPSGVFTAICIAYNIHPGTYLLIGMISDRKDIQYTRLSRGNNVDDIIINVPYGSRSLVTVKTFTEITTVTFWVYQNASASMNFEQNEASIIAIRIK